MATKRKSEDMTSDDKKSKREQTFIVKYTETRPFIIETCAACKICTCELSIKSEEGDNIKRQVGIEKHKNKKIRDDEKANKKITGFLVQKPETTLKEDDQDIILLRQ